MKISTHHCLSVALLLTLFLLSNCVADSIQGVDPILIGVTPEPNATEFINDEQKQPDLSDFKQIINETGWNANIMTNDSFTLFAPSNEAFDDFFENSDEWNSINDIPTEELTKLLDYHLVKGKRYILRDTIIKFLPTNSVSEFDGNNSLLVKTAGSIRINGERSVALQDIRLQNAVIHITSEVLAPIDLLTMVEAHPELSIFAKLLEREDIAMEVTELLSGAGPFTIFAPVDSAFLDLYTELGINSLGGISADILEEVLLNHIVPSSNLSTENLIASDKIGTLLPNQELTIGVSNNIKNVRSNNRTANLVATNGQGNNGIIHLIDKVLVPSN